MEPEELVALTLTPARQEELGRGVDRYGACGSGQAAVLEQPDRVELVRYALQHHAAYSSSVHCITPAGRESIFRFEKKRGFNPTIVLLSFNAECCCAVTIDARVC